MNRVVQTIGSTSVSAQTIETKLSASDAIIGNLFGYSISMSGNYLLVGAPEANANGVVSGAAYVFKFEGTNWVEKARLVASDSEAFHYFGRSVSIYDDYVLVGSVGDDENGSASGSVYVFKREGEVWTEKTKLIPSDGEAFDRFGAEVTLNENYALIGVPEDRDNGDFSGSAYIFKREGNIWTETAKLLPSDGAANDLFGRSVMIRDSMAFVGSLSDVAGVPSAGAVYFFKKQGGVWSEEAKLTANDFAIGAEFGSSISIFDEFLLIGAEGGGATLNDPGSAYIFRLQGNAWQEKAKLVATDGEDDDGFGSSVSLNGDYALIGASQDLANGFRSGSAYIFRREETSWVQDAKLLPDPQTNNNVFGFSASLEHDRAVIGSIFPSDSGTVYVFTEFFRDALIDITIDSLYQPVPMVGDTFPLDLAVRNTTADIQNLEYWTTVYKPDGTPLGLPSGPFNIEIQPMQTATVQEMLEILGSADAGIYKVVSQVGNYPNTVVHSDSTVFRKLGLGPSVSNPIADILLIENFAPTVIANLDTIFTHPNGLSLMYTAQTDGNTVAILPGSNLIIRSVTGFTGTSQIIVTATDEQPLSVADTFEVFVQVAVGVERDQNNFAQSFELLQNYPNPFNPNTIISFYLLRTQDVKLTIFALNGERVKTLINEQLHQGRHQVSWDGTNNLNQSVSSGIYLYRLSTDGFKDTKKMILLQ